MNIFSTEEIAYHEAGHVVACFILGLPFRYATIRSNKRIAAAGHIYASIWDLPHEIEGTDPEQLVCFAVMSCSGYEAQKIINPTANVDGSREDYSRARALLLACLEDESFVGISRQLDEIKISAGSLIRDNETRVHNAAKALLKHETLGYHALHVALKDAV